MDWKVREVLEPRPYILSTIQVFSKIIMSVKNGPYKRILDVGCRDGWSTEVFHDIGLKETVGLEIYQPFVEHANKRGRNVVLMDTHSLTFEDESFDAIFSRHTLEHCSSPERVIREYHRVLRENGLLFITLPMENKTSPEKGHLSFFPTPESLQLLIDSNGKFRTIYLGLSIDIDIKPIGKEVAYIGEKIL